MSSSRTLSRKFRTFFICIKPRFDPSIILLYIAASVEQYCDITQVNALPENEGIPEVQMTSLTANEHDFDLRIFGKRPLRRRPSELWLNDALDAVVNPGFAISLPPTEHPMVCQQAVENLIAVLDLPKLSFGCEDPEQRILVRDP